jgi:hypothetical protein
MKGSTWDRDKIGIHANEIILGSKRDKLEIYIKMGQLGIYIDENINDQLEIQVNKKGINMVLLPLFGFPQIYIYIRKESKN